MRLSTQRERAAQQKQLVRIARAARKTTNLWQREHVGRSSEMTPLAKRQKKSPDASVCSPSRFRRRRLCVLRSCALSLRPLCVGAGKVAPGSCLVHVTVPAPIGCRAFSDDRVECADCLRGSSFRSPSELISRWCQRRCLLTTGPQCYEASEG